MREPKFRKNGVTVQRPKITVFLHPNLYKALKASAEELDSSMSDRAASLISRGLKWNAGAGTVVAK